MIIENSNIFVDEIDKTIYLNEFENEGHGGYKIIDEFTSPKLLLKSKYLNLKESTLNIIDIMYDNNINMKNYFTELFKNNESIMNVVKTLNGMAINGDVSFIKNGAILISTSIYYIIHFQDKYYLSNYIHDYCIHFIKKINKISKGNLICDNTNKRNDNLKIEYLKRQYENKYGLRYINFKNSEMFCKYLIDKIFCKKPIYARITKKSDIIFTFEKPKKSDYVYFNKKCVIYHLGEENILIDNYLYALRVLNKKFIPLTIFLWAKEYKKIDKLQYKKIINGEICYRDETQKNKMLINKKYRDTKFMFF
jgi:hypothetical protein